MELIFNDIRFNFAKIHIILQYHGVLRNNNFVNVYVRCNKNRDVDAPIFYMLILDEPFPVADDDAFIGRIDTLAREVVCIVVQNLGLNGLDGGGACLAHLDIK